MTWLKKFDEKQTTWQEQNIVDNDKAILEICNLIDKYNIKLVHCNTTYTNIGAIAAHYKNIPIIWHIREKIDEQGYGYLDKNEFYNLVNNSERIITVSDFIKKSYPELEHNKTITIYDGIDTKKYYSRCGIFNENKVRILMPAAIYPLKRQEDLINAAILLRDKKISFSIDLIGAAEEKYFNKLQKIVYENKLASYINCLGKIDDINKYYKKSDIVVICSGVEAFGRVYVEAFLAGCLVIGAKSGATVELIRDKDTGLLYEYKNHTDLAQKIIDSDCIIIYGARTVAKEVAHCLTRIPYNKNIEAFMVSNKNENQKLVMGRPVITLEEGKKSYQDALVVVAVMDKYLYEIENNLLKNGFKNFILCGFESDLWSGIRGNFFKEICREKYGDYKTLEEYLNNSICELGKSVSIYSAKCHVDKELMDNRQYPWERQIQVGADLTEQIVCDIRDNMGENISAKNKMYCELTALYWIWKNEKSDYVGLGHYRRHFDLTENMVRRLGTSNIDVIVTIPILNFPSVRAIYENDHSIEDWNIMLQVLYEKSPDYYDAAVELQNGIYYYAYNMFIARKEIVDKYCEWLFPILFECEMRCEMKHDIYQGRYIGFLGERLLSIFLIHNWGKWNIVHAKKKFLL